MRAKGNARTGADTYDSPLEADFARYLELAKNNGLIARYTYKGMKFRVGIGAWYTPDFNVQDNEGFYTQYEVKGHWREAAKVRIKSAALLYPFSFVAVYRKGAMAFEFEDFSPKEAADGVV